MLTTPSIIIYLNHYKFIQKVCTKLNLHFLQLFFSIFLQILTLLFNFSEIFQVAELSSSNCKYAYHFDMKVVYHDKLGISYW